MKKIFLTSALALMIPAALLAQAFGELQARVRDAQGVPVVNVIVRVDGGGSMRGDATDLDGRARIGSLLPGVYTVKFSGMGYNTKTYHQVRILPEQITRLMDVVMTDSTLVLKQAEIIVHTIPLIRQDGGTVEVMTAKELKNLPAANGGDIKQIVKSMSADIKSSPSGNELYFRGSRSGSVVYFIDGVKIRENVPNIPSSGLSSISVYTGGVPAKYGDSTGGYVIIETKSYLEEYYERQALLRAEAVTSDLD